MTDTPSTPQPPEDVSSSESDAIKRALDQALNRYWKKNVCIMCVLLFFWAFFSLGCGVLWADKLNEYQLFNTGYPLGFWFAQQGSIIAFVLIILTYVLCMNRLDRTHGETLASIRKGRSAE